jgi:two-component system phosphate regulon sensor histidine kinase PhoR
MERKMQSKYSEPETVTSAASLEHLYRASTGSIYSMENHIPAIRQEIEFFSVLGKRFVAAIDRFHVHRALLTTLQELYSFSACCILLRDEPAELFIIPCQPISREFLEEMVHRISDAARAIDFPVTDPKQLIELAYFDAPDEVAQYRTQEAIEATEVGSSLNIPLTVNNRIIGILSLFDELIGTFDTDLLKMTSVIADYAAVALENVRLRERENALWREAELERQRLELILRSMTEALLIIDEQGIITSLNQSAHTLLSHIVGEVELGSSLHQLARENHASWLLALSEMVDHALDGITVTNLELLVSENAQQVPLTLHASITPLHDASGLHLPPRGAVVVLEDVTASKQVERIKDEFVSVVSHELRTPLTSIKGYTQHLIRRLERRVRRLHEQAEMPATELPESIDLRSLAIIQSQSDHLERLVDELLDRSRIQWGQLTLKYKTFYLADLLTEVVHSVQAGTEQHTILLDIQAQETLVTADYSRIEQVLGNLLDNAVKYSPSGGQVFVRLSEQQHDEQAEEDSTSDDEYVVSVSDYGIGISPDHLAHIFERFYRVSNSSTHQYSGVGLGLYVAKAIVEAQGGRIWVTSSGPLGKTTFSFTLPREPHTPSYTSHP